MRHFVGRDEEGETQKFPTVPSTSVPILHTEDWTVVDVTVRKGQLSFDRRIKEWQTSECCHALPDVSLGVCIQEVIRKFLQLCGEGHRNDRIVSLIHVSGVRKEVRVTDIYTEDQSFLVYI
jgi:hypothetical protein